MNKPIFLSTTAAAVILCTLCLALPVYQWATLPDDLALKALAAIAALALGICKLTFYPLAYDNLKIKRHLPAFCLFVVATVALLFSISASRDLLENITSTKHQAENVNSLAYKSTLKQLNDIEQNIETLSALINKDLEGNYRLRAYDKQKELKSLRAEKVETLKRLESIAVAVSPSAGGAFGKNISISLAGKNFALKASTGAALSLHLACIVAVLAVTSWLPTNTQQTSVKTEPKPNKTKEMATPKPEPKKENLDSDQLNLAKRIIAGEFGNKLVLRKLIQEKPISGGFKKIKPVFSYLIEGNHLMQSGRSYELVQRTMGN